MPSSISLRLATAVWGNSWFPKTQKIIKSHLQATRNKESAKQTTSSSSQYLSSTLYWVPFPSMNQRVRRRQLWRTSSTPYWRTRTARFLRQITTKGDSISHQTYCWLKINRKGKRARGHLMKWVKACPLYSHSIHTTNSLNRYYWNLLSLIRQ